jgi:hypothetical protein
MPPSPLLTINSSILWLKVILSAATLALLYVRYKRGQGKPSSAPPTAHSLRTKVVIVGAVLFSFTVFHNLGTFRGGSFIHYGEMFHYYLGSKYFDELGYYELYNAVIIADAEQDNALVGIPFYTDLRTYQNTQREPILGDAGRIKNLFSKERWHAFKEDVSFFKKATHKPNSMGLAFLLMDHGYNASPVSTFVLGMLTNAVPVTRLALLAALDVLLVAAMAVLVFRTFGFEMGALFSVYFSVNILNDHDYISGSLLRYDWLAYIIAAVCLLAKGRHASSAFFLTLAAMMRVFPAVLFYGIAVTILRKATTTRTLDKSSIRFVVAAGATALGLFLLPAVSLGSVLQPWKDFSAKTELHDRGVYVNHLGLRGIVLFEPSHLSLESFVNAYKHTSSGDIVRHWQDVKEREFKRKRPAVIVVSLVVLACLTVIIWKRRATESESVIWPALLIYTVSYPSHYYFAFLCLFILLFFRRANSRSAFIPLALLLVFNIGALVIDSFGPSPIVLFTSINICLFICLSVLLGFELYTSVFDEIPTATVASSSPPHERRREVKRRRRQARARGK